jgi:hypothetical protein
MGIVLQDTFQHGQPPLTPSIYNMKAVPPGEIGVPLTEVPMKVKLDSTKTHYCLMSWTVKLYQKDEANFRQRRLLPVINDLCLICDL